MLADNENMSASGRTSGAMLQGRYLGALKSLGATDKAKVKAVAREKGVPEALKLAASLKAKKK